MNKIFTENVVLLHGIFSKNDYKLYVVGGACRDLLLGLDPHDVDLCTDATPSEVELITRGVARVIKPESRLQGVTILHFEDGEDIEIATWRKESGYSDGKRPDEVIFTKDLVEDSRRRDLTVNSIYMDFEGNFMDPQGGILDIKRKSIRFVGSTTDRLMEDPIRLLRFFRFGAKLGFSFDSKNESEISNLINSDSFRARYDLVTSERIYNELIKLCESSNPWIAIQEIEKMNAWFAIHLNNRVDALRQCDQLDKVRGIHLEGSVWNHSMNVVEELCKMGSVTFIELVAALLHDVAKPVTKSITPEGKIQFIGHDSEGVIIADKILSHDKIAMSANDKKNILWLIGHHMTCHSIMELLRSKKSESYLKGLEITSHPLFGSLLKLTIADSKGTKTRIPGVELPDMASGFWDKYLSLPKPLINGNDIKNCGIEIPPIKYKNILRRLHGLQVKKNLDRKTLVTEYLLSVIKDELKY